MVLLVVITQYFHLRPILAVCRVDDFLQIASFQAVCYYQLKSFDQSLTEETVGNEAHDCQVTLRH